MKTGTGTHPGLSVGALQTRMRPHPTPGFDGRRTKKKKLQVFLEYPLKILRDRRKAPSGKPFPRKGGKKMIQAQIAGNVGSTRFTETAKGAVLTVSVASNRKGQETRWAQVKLWNNRAVALRDIIRTGDSVYASGQAELQTYDRDGRTTAQLVIHANTFEFLGGTKREKEAEPNPVEPDEN